MYVVLCIAIAISLSTYFLSKVLGYPNYYLIMFDLGIRLPFRNLSSLREKISNAELISSLAQHTFTGVFFGSIVNNQQHHSRHRCSCKRWC